MPQEAFEPLDRQSGVVGPQHFKPTSPNVWVDTLLDGVIPSNGGPDWEDPEVVAELEAALNDDYGMYYADSEDMLANPELAGLRVDDSRIEEELLNGCGSLRNGVDEGCYKIALRLREEAGL